MQPLARWSRIDGMRRKLASLIAAKAALAALAALSIVATGCGVLGDPGIELAVSRATPLPGSAAAAESGADALNAMGLDLFGVLAAADGNTVISPVSIGIALGMARAGARGTTADEMDEVTHGAASDEHGSWLASLSRELAARNRTIRDDEDVDHEVALHLANALFGQRGFDLHQEFLDALAARFEAGLRLVDFVADTDAARRSINGWVNDQTRDRIPELIGSGQLPPNTRLVLVNAVYLNAPWAGHWSAMGNGPLGFTRPGGSSVHVPMMMTDGRLQYAEGDSWQAVELPYLGDELAMLLVVPHDLPAFEAALDADRLATIVASLSERQTLVSMPPFEFETQADLIPTLKALGMHAAFDNADFSGISDSPLFISGVVHQANISVDTRGTEAAAATAVMMDVSAPYGEVEVHANRPFLFAIRDRATGAILFLGHVTDPSIGM